MSDRYVVIPASRAPLPATCAICGSGSRDVVDFGINIDYFGAFLMCLECAHHMVEVPELELMPKSAAIALTEQNDELQRKQTAAVTAMKEMQDGIMDSVDRYVLSINDLPSSGDVGAVQIREPEEPSLFSIPQGANRTVTAYDGSVISEGSNDLPGTSGKRHSGGSFRL